MSSVVCGSHAAQAYSTTGRTRETYAAFRTLLLQSCMFLLRKPIVLFALLAVFSMWSFHVRSSLILTPRYLLDDSTSRMCPRRVVCVPLHTAVGAYPHHCTLFWVEFHLPLLLPLFKARQVLL